MPDLLLLYATWTLVTVGGLFVVVGGIGILRMPEFYTRVHAASVTETLGTLLVLIGLMLQGGFSLVTLKLLAILIFLLITAPTAAYALANAAVLAGVKPYQPGRDTPPQA